MANRKRYSEEFKREAIGLTRQPGASVTQIARDIGVNAKPSHSFGSVLADIYAPCVIAGLWVLLRAPGVRWMHMG
jgi:hypothetical protein